MEPIETYGWEDPCSSTITIAQVSCYLLRHGWNQEEVANPRLHVYLYEGKDDLGNSIRLVLPDSDDSGDRRHLLAKTINLIAVIEDRSVSSVLEDICDKFELKDSPGFLVNPQISSDVNSLQGHLFAE